MKDQIGRAFCVLPWLHSFVNIGGEFMVCCTSEEFHRGIKTPEGGYFNIKDRPSLEAVMNSPFMKQVRLDLLDGKMPKLCTRCVITEKMDGVSRRHLENDKYRHEIEALIDSTRPDGSIPLSIKSADYRLGNICNLQCRMCNPRSTVMWIKDWNGVKTEAERMNLAWEKEYSSYDWIDDDCLIEDFQAKLEGLDTLHFAGGEPLVAPRMREMLQLCIDRGVAPNIKLTYNTNVTVLPPKVLELWKHFREVTLLCSVDGHGKVNEYVRMPSSWEVIDRNLRTLDQHAGELRISEILLSTTVQAYNVLALPELYAYLTTFKHVTRAPNLINLFTPSYLQTQVLPSPLKAEAERRLRALVPGLKASLPSYKEYLIDNIEQIINFMNSKDLAPKYWKEFIAYNQRVDLLKGMRLKDYIPELHQAFEGHYPSAMLQA